MQGISVPSRFSCLKIEDDESQASPGKSNNKKKPENKSNKRNIPANKKSPLKPNQAPTLNGTSKKNKSKGRQDDKQWEEWKKKDDEFVNENFEQDLQCALLQSKLDYEHQKKNSVSVIVTSQDKAKKKKTKTMSLDQFLEKNTQNPKKDEPVVEYESNFFEKAIDSAKKEVQREKAEEKRRERANNIEEVITLAQCQEKLEKEKQLNELLRQELENAKKEIVIVKKRNKTLCNMLSQGEMKDKAAVLLELEKLTTVKEELTEEVSRLHKLLEQERSSTKANSIPIEGHNTKHKDKNKRKKN